MAKQLACDDLEMMCGPSEIAASSSILTAPSGPRSVTPTTRTLRSAWGSLSGEVWAVGHSGTVLRFTR